MTSAATDELPEFDSKGLQSVEIGDAGLKAGVDVNSLARRLYEGLLRVDESVATIWRATYGRSRTGQAAARNQASFAEELYGSLLAILNEATDAKGLRPGDRSSVRADAHRLLRGLRASHHVDLPHRDLLARTLSCSYGDADAYLFERRVSTLLSSLFEPHLMPHGDQVQVNTGRKRIDLVFVNEAEAGFFNWLSRSRLTSLFVMVEAKNYVIDSGNEEFDQLSGRLTRDRGQVGLLVARGCSDRTATEARARDLMHRDNACLFLDDSDLEQLVEEGSAGGNRWMFPSLRQKFLDLT